MIQIIPSSNKKIAIKQTFRKRSKQSVRTRFFKYMALTFVKTVVCTQHNNNSVKSKFHNQNKQISKTKITHGSRHIADEFTNVLQRWQKKTKIKKLFNYEFLLFFKIMNNYLRFY